MDRLDLERYKATIKGLTAFGDRREGTDRNRAAIDWIENQLQSYGCATARMQYTFTNQRTPRPPLPQGFAVGGGRYRGRRAPTGVNTDPARQPDEKLRALNAQPSSGAGPREQVYCTKVGTARPDEMYIVSAHMDGHGWGEAANDNASGTAVVMELARILSAPEVTLDRSVRFILWNNEETGLNGSGAYASERRHLQGREDPPGSGRYPEPRWLGVIQHDMMLFDHGMPREDGTVSPRQRAEADIDIEFQADSTMAAASQALAWALHAANRHYAADYPAEVGPHMTNTDSASFQDVVAAVSVRENQRGVEIGAGWNPHWHQPTDVFGTFADEDFRLGLNAAQTTLAAVAQLAGARLSSPPKQR